MNILTYTNLYPNNVDPTHGIFVQRRLAMLAESTDIRPVVVAPVPWFPSKAKAFGRYAAMAAIASFHEDNGIAVHHPRYPVLPTIGMGAAPWLMAAGTRHRVKRAIAAHGPVELVDAHYFYPDGVAAAMLAGWLGLPYVITARGSDINLIAKYPWPRRLMLRAAANAAAIIAVSRSLAKAMIGMGMPESRIHVLRNGVDLELFSPASRCQAGGHRSTTSPTFLSVGALKAAKGHDIAIRFIHRLPAARLVIAGSGPDERRLRQLCDRLGVAPRVRFAGVLDAESLRDCYRAADALILMSEREGMPNVVLESLACGTPVLAANVGGIAEIVFGTAAGVLVDQRNEEALAAGWRELQARGIESKAVRRHAEQFSWAETIAGLHDLMHSCVRSEVPKGEVAW